MKGVMSDGVGMYMFPVSLKWTNGGKKLRDTFC